MEPEALDAHLFLPGPTPVPADVALAEALPMTDHRAPAFDSLLTVTAGRLARLFQTSGATVVLPSSGTGALEAALVNLFRPGDRVLAVVAGAFGARWADQAEAMGLAVDRLEVEWGRAVDPEAVKARLDGHRGVLVTQNETSTGVLQDVRAVAACARDRAPEALVVVDAISGFPAVPLPMDAWGVDAAVCGSQKAFMLPPGLSFVALGPRALETARAPGGRRYYFDLRPYLDGGVPYTPAVSLYYALERALDRLEREGEAARHRRHRTLMRIVRAGARAVGLEPLSPDAEASPTVTALIPPDGVSPQAVRAAGAETGARFGGGLGPLAERVLRIGHVGHLDPLDAVAAVAAAEMALARARGGRADGRGAAAAVAAWQAAEEEARRADARAEAAV